MKRNIILLFLLPALLIAGCENPMDDHGPDAGGPTTFTATIEGGDGTKTTLGDPDAVGVRAVKWSGDDAISIGGATYTVSSGAGTTSATFTGSGATLSEGKYKAYYPAKIYHGGTPTLPATQTYVAGRIDNLPMYAEAVSPSTDLNFKNLCAVLEFKLTGSETVGSIGLKSTEGKKLSGAFTPQNWASDSRSVVMSESASDTVTLYCGTSGVALNATTPKSFFVAVPAQDYSLGTLKVTVKKPNGDEITSFTNSVSDSQLERSKIYEIGKSAKQPFSVTYGSVTTSSAGTPVTASGTIAGDDVLNPYLGTTHTFTISSDRGYKVTISDKYVAFADKQSNPASGENVTVSVAGRTDRRYGGNSEFQRNAVFSVSATQQVHFSPGNLQFRAKRADGVSTYSPSNTFRFAEHQYDVVGTMASNPKTYQYAGNVLADTYDSTDPYSWLSRNELVDQNYTGWIDFFGWGTSGKDYGVAHSMPYEYIDDESGYGPASGNLTLAGESDWGAADIWDGNDLIPGGTYRTLSTGEWSYLVSGRNVLQTGWCSSKVTFTASDATKTFQITFEAYDDPSYAVTYNVTVTRGESWSGLLIFPDDFADTDLISRAGLSYGGSPFQHFNAPPTFVDAVLWPEFERAGCVFFPRLPLDQRYYSSTTGNFSFASYIDILYWSSRSQSAPYAYTNKVGQELHGVANKHGGLPVRLVKDVTP